MFAGLLLSFGVFGDRFGRKLALQAGTAIFGLASLCVLLVDTPDQLIAVRAVMGAGGALIMPATLSIIANVFPREERGKAIAAWSAAASVGDPARARQPRPGAGPVRPRRRHAVGGRAARR